VAVSQRPRQSITKLAGALESLLRAPEDEGPRLRVVRIIKSSGNHIVLSLCRLALDRLLLAVRHSLR
jgi:hypothetical protein